MTDFYDLPGHLIRRMHQISVASFAARMADRGVDLTPVQFAALSAIADHPGIDQATLAGLIAYDRVTIGGVVDRLESKGLLRRAVSKQDRRARVLDLTAEGEGLLGRIGPAVREAQEGMLSGLSETERGTLMRLLRKATEAGNSPQSGPAQR